MTTSEQLIRDIEAAFANVSLGAEATLHEWAAFEGTNYASAEERARVRALHPETRWQDIPDHMLVQFADYFAFDEFHLPAYMRWHLRHPEGLGPCHGWLLFQSLSVTGHKEKDRLVSQQWLGRFTPEQKHVIARFVEWTALESSEAWVRESADQAWQSYWHKYGEPDRAANGSQPIRSKTNQTSTAAGSRR